MGARTSSRDQFGSDSGGRLQVVEGIAIMYQSNADSWKSPGAGVPRESAS